MPRLALRLRHGDGFWIDEKVHVELNPSEDRDSVRVIIEAPANVIIRRDHAPKDRTNNGKQTS